MLPTARGGEALASLIRTIPDFPKPGIQFRDITTLLKDPAGFRQVVDALAGRCRAARPDKVVAIEARGFVLGGALAHQLGCGFVMARKPGKLPAPVRRQEYALEYGTDCLEIHCDGIGPAERCLVVDDVLATGGTCAAACAAVEGLGGRVAGCAFLVALTDLGGQERLARYVLHWLVEFGGAGDGR